MTVGLFDLLLVPTLIILAWQLLRVNDLFVCIVLYILFGLLCALAWVELRAPDIALVEAAVGAGVIGALFLGVLGRIEGKRLSAVSFQRKNQDALKNFKLFLWVLVAAATGILCWSVLTLSPQGEGLGPLVYSQLAQSGAKNPVTAVIINFRGYDTFLEIGVLFLVALAIHALRAIEPEALHTPMPPRSRMLIFFLHLLTPMMILLAGYLLWIGSDAPGGAFQAGAILTGAGTLLLLEKVRFLRTTDTPWSRLALASGFAAFLLTGVFVMGKGKNFLQYPELLAKELILFIEILATVSIGTILLSLFAGCSGFLAGNKEITNRGKPS